MVAARIHRRIQSREIESNLSKQKTPIFRLRLFGPATGYSSRTGLGPSTIAAGELNYRVRDGNGCFLTA